jgi:hypothetical protein
MQKQKDIEWDIEGHSKKKEGEEYSRCTKPSSRLWILLEEPLRILDRGVIKYSLDNGCEGEEWRPERPSSCSGLTVEQWGQTQRSAEEMAKN